MTQLYCFCGTGGTGKTVTLDALKRLRPELNYFSSISREFYEMKGLENQRRASDLSPREHFNFQLEMFQYYIRSTTDRLAAKSGVAVFERSIICHAAYCFESCREIDNGDYNYIIGMVDIFLRDFKPTIFYFPYPCPWTGDPATRDGFRVTDMGKNLVLNSLMMWMLNQRRGLFIPVVPASVEIRAEGISRIIGK